MIRVGDGDEEMEAYGELKTEINSMVGMNVSELKCWNRLAEIR